MGRLGEEFVLELECKRLRDEAQRPDLAKQVEWTSNSRGDGAGYDIASFNPDGSTRLIEVKTTGHGKYFSFCVSRNEVRCSEARASEYHLYRVFSFGTTPRLYTLNGALTSVCSLDPTEYRARFRSGQASRG